MSCQGLTQSVMVGHRAGDVLGGSGHQDVVAVLSLLQGDQLGVSGGGGLHGLESGGLVGEGLLGHGGDGMDGVGGVWEAVAAVEQLRGAVCRHGQDRENNLTERRGGESWTQETCWAYQELHVGVTRAD